MDKLRAITVFSRVVELGSFTAAAEDLKLSKAAVSKNISELEQFLGSPLINRTTRRQAVTDDGQNYYQQVRRILDDLESADRTVQESSVSLSGVLKISVPMSFGLVLINSAICEFMKVHPAIKVELVLSDQYSDIVGEGFDLAIRGGGKLQDSSLKQRKLFTLKRVLCASPAYLADKGEVKHPQDLTQHNCLTYSLSLSGSQWTCRQGGEQQSITISQSAFVANNGLALVQAAVAGLGIALSPEALVRAELSSKQLIPILRNWTFETQALYAIYPAHRETSYKLRALIDFLVDYLASQ